MHQHDCVIIPNLGGLVANYTPGFMDAKSKMMHPPKKGFVWNRFLKHNDGLLAHEICKNEGVLYEEAIKQIDVFVGNLNLKVAKGERFTLETIGSFYLEEKDVIRFSPKKETYLLSSFGLPVVKAVALPKLETIEAKELLSKDIPEIPVVSLPKPEEILDESKVSKEVRVEKPLGKVIAIQEPIDKDKTIVRLPKWWIAAALIPLGFYTAWIPMKTKMINTTGNFQMSDLNPFSYEKPLQAYGISPISIENIDSLNKVDFTALQNMVKSANSEINDYVETPESTYVDVETPEISYYKVSKKTYFLIGGCFADKDNALNFVDELKSQGYDAVLVDYNEGLHRVAFGTYSSRDAAKAVKEEVSAKGDYSTWVLKKEV